MEKKKFAIGISVLSMLFAVTQFPQKASAQDFFKIIAHMEANQEINLKKNDAKEDDNSFVLKAKGRTGAEFKHSETIHAKTVLDFNFDTNGGTSAALDEGFLWWGITPTIPVYIKAGKYTGPMVAGGPTDDGEARNFAKNPGALLELGASLGIGEMGSVALGGGVYDTTSRKEGKDGTLQIEFFGFANAGLDFGALGLDIRIGYASSVMDSGYTPDLGDPKRYLNKSGSIFASLQVTWAFLKVYSGFALPLGRTKEVVAGVEKYPVKFISSSQLFAETPIGFGGGIYFDFVSLETFAKATYAPMIIGGNVYYNVAPSSKIKLKFRHLLYSSSDTDKKETGLSINWEWSLPDSLAVIVGGE